MLDALMILGLFALGVATLGLVALIGRLGLPGGN